MKDAYDTGVTRVRSILGGLGVLTFWYALAVGLLAWWIARLPSDIPDDDCGGLGCFDPQSSAILITLAFGPPALLVGSLVSATVYAVLVARLRSAILAATIAVLPGWFAVLAAVLVLAIM